MAKPTKPKIPSANTGLSSGYGASSKESTYGGRVKNSFFGFKTGIVMLIIGTITLWNNEGRTAKMTSTLDKVEAIVEEMPYPQTVDPQFNGKVVHTSGFATTADTISDNFLGVKDNAIAIFTDVEYYQWEEEVQTKTRTNSDGKKVDYKEYHYYKNWVSSPINSSDFNDRRYRDKNFTLLQADETETWAENVTFEAYKLPEGLFKTMTSKHDLMLNGKIEPRRLREIDNLCLRKCEGEEALREALLSQRTDSLSRTASDTLGGQDRQWPGIDLKYVQVRGNMVYLGPNSQEPHIGDVRIYYEKITPDNVSIIAKVVGNTFKEYYNPYEKQTYWKLTNGLHESIEMIDDSRSDNSVYAWTTRILGILLIVGGLKCAFSIIPALFSFIPMLGKIVEKGVGLVCWLVGVIWSILVIGVAWLFYRPVVGVILLLIVAGVIFYMRRKPKPAEPEADDGSYSNE